MKSAVACLTLGLLLFFSGTSQAQPGNPEGMTYKTSFKSVRMLGIDIQKSLRQPYRDKVHVEPVSIETDVTPFVRLEEYPDEQKPMPMVFISVGFIDLVNNLAHAKAIDLVEKGYFEKYVLALSKETGEKELLELPGLANEKFWTDDVLNEQLSNFNSIVGILIGIKLAHHYTGHFKKYEKQLIPENGPRVPINNVITPKEWEEALKFGVRNALDGGCMVEGVIPFFEAFEKMPT
ncbi:MAG: hypothetical protein AB1813_06335, partial [Verrucomicrobiota bacterium]